MRKRVRDRRARTLVPDITWDADSLGEAYERKGEIDLARERYTRAAESARENGDRLLSFYERRIANLDRPSTP